MTKTKEDVPAERQLGMRPLAVIGNVNVDIIIGTAEPWPKPGTEILVDHGEVRVGGAAGNTGLAWQAKSVPFQMACNVGDDQFGRWLQESFSIQSPRWPTDAASTTFSVGVTHPDGERTFFTSPGHIPLLSLDAVRHSLDINALRGGIALVCGCFLTDRLTADYQRLFTWLKEQGIEIALDTGWPPSGWNEDARRQVMTWLPFCDHLLLNEVEVTCLTAKETVSAAIASLLPNARPGAAIVVKLGAAGAVGRRLTGGTAECVEAAAPKVAPVDTIGAGDVFNAGYLAAIAGGKDLQAAVAAGVALASRAIATLPRRYDSAVA